MRGPLLGIACCALALAGATGMAQEGHPMKGSWIGEWTGNATHGDNVLLVLDWNGEAISGIINPGTDNIPITAATLDPEQWTVRIEAEAETESGTALQYVIEGTIHDLALPSRYVAGTWRNEQDSGSFEVRRQ